MEPRLAQKLRPKFRELLVNQKAKSVEFELIRAIIQGVKGESGEDRELQGVARERLKGFIQAKDPNRKSHKWLISN